MEFGVTPQILSKDIMLRALEHLKRIYRDKLFETLFRSGEWKDVDGITKLITYDVNWSEYTIYR